MNKSQISNQFDFYSENYKLLPALCFSEIMTYQHFLLFYTIYWHTNRPTLIGFLTDPYFLSFLINTWHGYQLESVSTSLHYSQKQKKTYLRNLAFLYVLRNIPCASTTKFWQLSSAFSTSQSPRWWQNFFL